MLRHTQTSFLKLASDAEYTAYLQRKLVGWYAAAPKSDRHAPAGEEADDEAPEAGEGQGRGAGGSDALHGLVNHCNLISRPKKADRRTGRAAAAFDSNRGASEPDRGRF